MATGLKSRIIYRVKEKDNDAADYWAGTYKLLIRAKEIPSPFGAVNMVDTSTLEDVVETQEQGRRSAASMEISGAFVKANKDSLIADEGKELDIVILYGTDGKGSEGMCAFFGTESFAPDSATSDHLTGTATVAVHSVPKWIEDNYTVSVTLGEDGYPTQVTVAKKVG